MQTAALLVVLAVVGGFIVVRTVFRDERPRVAAAATSAAEPSAGTEPAPGGIASGRPVRSDGGRRSRRLLTTAALTDALAIDGDEERRPSFFGRTLAFGRLLLVILFICALAGGTLFWLAMMIASKAHIHPS